MARKTDMTEAEWLASDETDRVLRSLLKRLPSERKLRLFGCGCLRRHWGQLTHQSFRLTVEVCEDFADGRCALGKLKAAHARVRSIPLRDPSLGSALRGMWLASSLESAVRCVSHPEIRRTILVATRSMRTGDKIARLGTVRRGRIDAHQTALLRDIFGNPFRPDRVEPHWWHANNGAAFKVAEAIYQERAFDRMPILADALEEAGCDDAAVLEHCRGPGPHVRGCWVVDLVLGKK